MHPKIFFSIILFLLTISHNIEAQLALCNNFEVQLLRDINDIPTVHQLNNVSIVHNGILYYTFDDGIHGQELWRSDRTEQGTEMIEDLHPGSSSSGIDELVLINDQLYFKADDGGANGCELYSMNLSVAHPEATLVKDIVPGEIGSCPSNLIEVDGELFFIAYSPTIGRELWKSDGTSGGTSLVLDIDGMATSSETDYFFSAIGKLFFTVDLPDTGEELWVSDGTANGTHILKDIYPGTRSFTRSFNLQLIEFDDAVFFRGATDISNSTLWKTDGTSLGTNPLQHDANAYSDFEPSSLTVVGDRLYLRGSKASSFDRELFVCDGTNVSLVKDIFTGTEGSNLSELTDVDGILFFKANDGINGSELWKSDGTSGGTQMILDITVGGSSNIQNVTYVDGNVFFFNQQSGSSTELWKSGGTIGSTVELYNWSEYVEDIEAFQMINEFFFIIDLDDYGKELWYSAGTPTTTGILQDLAIGTTSSSPHNFTIDEMNKNVFFFAHTDNTGLQLYNSVLSGPIQFLGVKSILGEHSRGIESSFETYWGNKAVIRVNKSGTEDISYWVSDGTSVGTFEGNLGAFNVFRRFSFADAGSHFMIIHEDENNDFQLIQSDGTAAGTSLITNFGDINYAFLITTIDHTAIFYKIENNQLSLWSIRPNEQPLLLSDNMGVAELEDQWAEDLFFDGDFFFFTRGSDEVNLWRTDGTPLGTGLIHTFDETRIEAAHAFDDKIIILSSDNPSGQRTEYQLFDKSSMSGGPQVWVSDGSVGGTNLVTELSPEISISISTTLNDKVIFSTSEEGAAGRSITTQNKSSQSPLIGVWSTDGTANGTFQLISLERAAILNTASDKVFFTSAETQEGRILYSTDGTINGTSGFDFNYDTPIFLHDDELNADVMFSMGGQAILPNTLGCQGSETYIVDDMNQSLDILYDISNYEKDPSEIMEPIPLGDKTIMLLDNGVTGAELYSIDCSCRSDLSIDDMHMEDGEFHANRKISILAHTRPSSNISLKFGNSIEFENGFTTGNSSQITVEIGNCTQ